MQKDEGNTEGTKTATSNKSHEKPKCRITKLKLITRIKKTETGMKGSEIKLML